MATDSPFLIFKVECPLCKTINEFELIRVGAYTEESRDTDFCPLNIKWRYPRYQAHHPLLYFTAMCAHCYYTREFNNAYKDWKNDNQFRTYRLRQVKERHLEQLSRADSVIKQLGDHVDVAAFPNESAVLKLLLAIYDEQLADHPNDLDLGRFYLRVGWLFREMDKGDNPQVVRLRGLLQEMRAARKKVDDALAVAGTETEGLRGTVEGPLRSKELPAELSSRILSFSERFSAELDAIENGLAACREHVAVLATIVDEYQAALLGTEGTDGELSFGEHSSFVAFLESLRDRWDGIVSSEHEALTRAVQHYKKAFVDGRDIAPGNQQIQALYLIAELSRRIGDYDTAREYFNSTIKTGQEFVYRNRGDQSRTALARKILELAIEQGRMNMAEAKPV